MLAKGRLILPRSKVLSENFEGKTKLVFKGAHEYHINSLNINADGENYLSADELKINIWSLGNNSTAYNVLDIKPKSIEELDEVVTHAEFSMLNPSMFLYTTSKGLLHICDFKDRSTFITGSSHKLDLSVN